MSTRCTIWYSDKLDPLLQAYKDAIKRRLAERGEKNG